LDKPGVNTFVHKISHRIVVVGEVEASKMIYHLAVELFRDIVIE